ncbi:MAG: DsbA family protein [Bdellovibrionales bacterium]
MKLYVLLTAGLMLALSACVNKDSLKKTMVENPEILFEVIEKNPDKFLEVVNKAAREAQMKARERQAQDDQKRLDDEFNNPRKPSLEGKHFQGKADAPIVIVEYSDFECPYCTRGYNTIQEVKKAYGDKVKFVYKHLPLDFHPLAMPAAQYFEAIAKQSVDKAFKFHDAIFENQGKLKSGKEKWMQDTAKKLGVNVKKMLKDAESAEVKARIQADIAEARKFGISGTPGFIINGVTLKGAYPFPEFKRIIDKHLAKK